MLLIPLAVRVTAYEFSRWSADNHFVKFDRINTSTLEWGFLQTRLKGRTRFSQVLLNAFKLLSGRGCACAQFRKTLHLRSEKVDTQRNDHSHEEHGCTDCNGNRDCKWMVLPIFAWWGADCWTMFESWSWHRELGKIIVGSIGRQQCIQMIRSCHRRVDTTSVGVVPEVPVFASRSQSADDCNWPGRSPPSVGSHPSFRK